MKKKCSDFDITGKVAVVTGAGRGIGRQISLALAKYGADIVACDILVPELEQVGKEIETLGRRALIRKMDITRIPEVHAMVDAAVNAYGHIDILINNAGINIPQKAEDVTEEAWDRTFNVNLKGTFFCTQAVGRTMIQQKKGSIINVSSQSGVVGLPLRAAYCSTKGGVNQLTKVLAVEWAKHHIRVNAIAPTFIETPLTKSMFEEPGFREYVLDNILLGRLGRPEDVTGAVVYLASEASNLVTGHILMIDGGWTAH